MKFFPQSFIYLLFALASIIPCSKASKKSSINEDQSISPTHSPQFVNTDFVAFFKDQNGHIDRYLVDCSQKILKCVREFFRYCDPSFVQTALFQLESFAVSIISLNSWNGPESVEKIGQVRQNILDLVKDVPMVTSYIYPLAYFTFNRTLRAIIRRKRSYSIYFPPDSFIIEEIFARYQPNEFDPLLINPKYNHFSIRDVLFVRLISHDVCLKSTLHLHSYDLTKIPSFIFAYFKLLMRNFKSIIDVEKYQILSGLFISPLREFQDIFEVMFSSTEITLSFSDTRPISFEPNELELVVFTALKNPRLSYYFVRSRFFIIPKYDKTLLSLYNLLNSKSPLDLFEYVNLAVSDDTKRLRSFLSLKYSQDVKKIDEQIQNFSSFKEEFDLTYGRTRLSIDVYSNFLKNFTISDVNEFLITAELCLPNFNNIMNELASKYEKINLKDKTDLENGKFAIDYSNIDEQFLRNYFEALLIFRSRGVEFDSVEYFVEDDKFFFDSEKSLFKGKVNTFSINLGSLNLKDVTLESEYGKLINRRLVLIIYGAYYRMTLRVPTYSSHSSIFVYDDSNEISLFDSLVDDSNSLNYSSHNLMATALDFTPQNKLKTEKLLVRDAFCLYLCLKGINPEYILKFKDSQERYTSLHFIGLPCTKKVELKSILENNNFELEDFYMSRLVFQGIVACGNLLHNPGIDTGEEDRLIKVSNLCLKIDHPHAQCCDRNALI